MVKDEMLSPLPIVNICDGVGDVPSIHIGSISPVMDWKP